MKADLTRDSFDPQKQFSRVLMQQGRVQLDADWNEQVAILVEATRQLARDTMGDGGSVDAFSLTVQSAPVGDGIDIEIVPGTRYVDGVACEARATRVPVMSFAADGAKQNFAVAFTPTQWTVDGIGYAVGQWLRIKFDGSPVKESPLVAVSQIDYVQGMVYMTPEVETDVAVEPGVAIRPFAQRAVTYLTQPHYRPDGLPAQLSQFYLDVWERLVTPIEDDSIREVALNGASTADRVRVVWQVKACAAALMGVGKPICMSPFDIAYTVRGGLAGALRARVTPAQASTDPCTVAPGSPYRGAENQLYRVEVNTGGSVDSDNPLSGATFKWSRDNGAVAFAVLSVKVDGNTTTVTLASLGPDERFGLALGDLVEIQDDDSALNERAGQLLAVLSIDRPSRTVVLDGAVPGVNLAGKVHIVGTDPAMHPLMRRWDHGSAPAGVGAPQLAADGCLVIGQGRVDVGPWIAIEDGIEVMFEPPSQVRYRTGDYWLIPARIATADVIWPQDSVPDANGGSTNYPAAMQPHGPKHRYLALALYDPDGRTFTDCSDAEMKAPPAVGGQIADAAIQEAQAPIKMPAAADAKSKAAPNAGAKGAARAKGPAAPAPASAPLPAGTKPE